MDRLRAGDTPELLTWALLAAPTSAHEGRLGRHSVSESATSEPEPVLPSVRSKLPLSARVSASAAWSRAPGYAVCVPRGRELSLRAEPKPKLRDDVLVVFHMLLPHGEACEACAARSGSLLLSAMPPRVLMLRARGRAAASRHTRGVWRWVVESASAGQRGNFGMRGAEASA
jgi:hypothetical protein